jgi:hypothetical protein
MISCKEGWGMKRLVVVLLTAVLGVALLCLGASQKLVNQTGAPASGVTLTFSEAVRITSYDKSVFPNQSQASGESESFTFSGGTLIAGGTFQVTWSPSNVKLMSTKWITSDSGDVAAASASAIPTTYEEITAKIAHYPGPDEPVYVPAEGEAIWLTDLEGHADIYDNDSIKINYAPRFDKSQITKIEVYRNGIKMRFLPDKLDVLTNDQMKTFDGNPLENTPKSSHTDHAIFGYEYSFRFTSAAGSAAPVTATCEVLSPVKFTGPWRSASVGNYFYGDFPTATAELQQHVGEIRDAGFNVVQVDVSYFMNAKDANSVFAQYTDNAEVSWLRTATPDEVRKILRVAASSGTRTELRLQIWLTERYKRTYPGWIDRQQIAPANVAEWFQNWGDICVEQAKLAQEEQVESLCVSVELNSMERYAANWRELIARVRQVFSGRVTISQSTHWYLEWGSMASQAGSFWDACDTIEMNCYPTGDGSQSVDQRLSTLIEGFVRKWAPAVEYFKRQYPGKPLLFGEIGTTYADGTARYDPGSSAVTDRMDIQEYVDIWASYLIGAQVLGIDGLSVWCVRISPDYQRQQWLRASEYAANYSHAIKTLASFLK